MEESGTPGRLGMRRISHHMGAALIFALFPGWEWGVPAVALPVDPTSTSRVTQADQPSRGNAVLRISIRGAPGVEFAGLCTLDDDERRRTLEIQGLVPQFRELRGEKLTCRFQKIAGSGVLDIEVRKGKAIVNRSRTTGLGHAIFISIQ